LLKDAERLASEGRAVYIVTETKDEAKRLSNQFGIGKAEKLGVKFETTRSCNFDWQKLTTTGAHPNCVFLVDHYAVESHFSAALEMLHRYDS